MLGPMSQTLSTEKDKLKVNYVPSFLFLVHEYFIHLHKDFPSDSILTHNICPAGWRFSFWQEFPLSWKGNTLKYYHPLFQCGVPCFSSVISLVHPTSSNWIVFLYNITGEFDNGLQDCESLLWLSITRYSYTCSSLSWRIVSTIIPYFPCFTARNITKRIGAALWYNIKQLRAVKVMVIWYTFYHMVLMIELFNKYMHCWPY